MSELRASRIVAWISLVCLNVGGMAVQILRLVDRESSLLTSLVILAALCANACVGMIYAIKTFEETQDVQRVVPPPSPTRVSFPGEAFVLTQVPAEA